MKNQEKVMTNMEIYTKIQQNNKIIESLFNPSQWTLNNAVAELLEENRALQKQCKHNFVDGYCEYCMLEEPKNDKDVHDTLPEV